MFPQQEKDYCLKCRFLFPVFLINKHIYYIIDIIYTTVCQVTVATNITINTSFMCFTLKALYLLKDCNALKGFYCEIYRK